MKISAAVTCVNYADFLKLTLPHSMETLGSLTVLTAPEDLETQKTAHECGAAVYVSDGWTRNGDVFNKARVINEWLSQVELSGHDQWFLTLDADILLPADIFAGLCDTDTRKLYSVRRRMCKTKEEWNNFVLGTLRWDDFKIYVPEIVNGYVWGRKKIGSNPSALCGYFQLWNSRAGLGAKRFPEKPSARAYDVWFALSFPEDFREFLQDKEVLHLGPDCTNWSGRVSEKWDNVMKLPVGSNVWD